MQTSQRTSVRQYMLAVEALSIDSTLHLNVVELMEFHLLIFFKFFIFFSFSKCY